MTSSTNETRGERPDATNGKGADGKPAQDIEGTRDSGTMKAVGLVRLVRDPEREIHERPLDLRLIRPSSTS